MLIRLTLIAVLSLAFLTSGPALLLVSSSAQASRDHFSVPLVVIRFNQPRMYYERPLFNAVAKALNTKADVHFNVIQYYPTHNERARQKADADFQELLGKMREMGIPHNRLGVKREPADDLDYAEVHIYVR